jgi:octaprenyl-diphosphate synthase
MANLKHKILSMAKTDLVDIEKALRDNLGTYLDLVDEAARHILFSGGKRLRPLLCVLSARICGYTGTYDKTFSTIFEYLHAATLLHDDLVDSATLRRGKPVANAVFGNTMAVLVGDFLFSRSLSIALGANRLKIMRVIAAITENLTQGELHQLIRKGNIDLTEEEYMEIIHRKTAALISGACRAGALLAEASEKKEAALSNYGFHLGLAFQITDDLLDYTADTETLGKSVGADLKEGKLTLPVIHVLNKADARDRSLLIEIINNEEVTPQDFDTFAGLLKRYGGIDYAGKMAEKHIAEAVEAVSIFNDSEAKKLLLLLADYAASRES